MSFSGVFRGTGAVIVVLSLLVALYGPSSAAISLFVGASAAYGLVLLMGGDFVVRKTIARLSAHTETMLDERS